MDEAAVRENGVHCPNCGSGKVTVQLFQENTGTTKVSRTKSKYKRGGHGLLWWLLIGWWWWIVDLMLWIFLFFPRLLIQIIKPKKKKGKSTTVEQTINQTSYKTVCLCQSCGHNWVQSETSSGMTKDAVKTSVKNLKKAVK